MSDDEEPTRDEGAPGPVEGGGDAAPGWVIALQVVVLLFVFLVGVKGLGAGFKGLGKDAADVVFQATSNPFVGLVVGILATTLMQSSSVTTSMVVGLVAAPDNPLPVANAIPMIMGANIGTTVTNTVVSLGHVGRADEFRRAFAAATCHDFFNFMAVAALLPLELATGVLSKLSLGIVEVLGTGGPGTFPNPVKSATKAALAPLQRGLELVSDSATVQGVGLIVASAVIIFTALYFIVRVLRRAAEGKLRDMVERSLGKSPVIAMAIGAVVTVMVQLSSITTSILVPLAAAGLVRLEQVFPITLGANIGTTVTALLASMAAPTETAALAVQIASVHLLFNLVATLLVYPIPRIRNLPLAAARWLADVATANKRHALVYVLALFYGLPALLIALSRSV